VIRTLSPLNRQTALAAGSNSAQVATTLDTQNVYSTDGTELLETLGPQHQVTLASGTTTLARQDTTNTYGATSTWGQGLLTKTVEGALEPGASSDVDTRTTSEDYSGQTNLGLTLGTPTSVTTDPSGLDIVHTTKYDNNGNVVATIQPNNPSGGDAHETDTTYYRAGTGSGVAACDSKAWFAGLVCQTAPAAQPGGSLPAIPTTQYTYDLYGNTLTRTDTSGTTTRTWSYGYDAADRLSTTSVTGFGTSLPQITQHYDAATGLPSTTTDGTVTISRTYDNLGRLKTYTDADGNTSTYAYTLDDQVASLNDGKGTQTYTYQTTSEERGLLTTISDSAAGTFTGTYDADGNLLSQALPNGITECTSYDATDEPIGRSYIEGGTCASPATVLLDYTVGPSIHGQWLTQSGPLSSQAYTYDAAGRLSQVQDTVSGQCTTRQYGYDADSNRTGYVSTSPGAGGACQSGTLATVHTYDAADRLTDTGTTYDAMGNTTTLPASDNGGTQLTASYYADSRIDTLTESSVTDTYTIDPAWRTRTVSYSNNSGATQTYHYSMDDDSPSWIATNTTGTTWSRNVEGVDGLLAAIGGSSGTITFQLADLHGSVCAVANAAGSILATYDYLEFGQPRMAGPTPYGWIGSHERSTDATTGAVTMGQRTYAPTLGRFLQTDPVPGGSANAYDYSNGDPVNSSDLDGGMPPPTSGCARGYTYIQSSALFNSVPEWRVILTYGWCWGAQTGIRLIYEADSTWVNPLLGLFPAEPFSFEIDTTAGPGWTYGAHSMGLYWKFYIKQTICEAGLCSPDGLTKGVDIRVGLYAGTCVHGYWWWVPGHSGGSLGRPGCNESLGL
jgi:RHS repeat-associated protein